MANWRALTDDELAAIGLRFCHACRCAHDLIDFDNGRNVCRAAIARRKAAAWQRARRARLAERGER